MTVRSDHAEPRRPAVDAVRRARALVFDFDGTLVASNTIKWHAFEQCFEDFSEERSVIVEYCRGGNHTPRGEKFRYVYETILRRPYTADIAAMLHRRFEAETTAQIIAAPARSGAEEFLEWLRPRSVCAVLSSTPQNILEYIIAERGWQRYFEIIRGAPVDKAQWLQEFRRGRRFRGREVVFFGDSPEDAAAARKARCTFIAPSDTPFVREASLTVTDFRAFVE